MEEDLIALLLATAGITSLVSTRIYWTQKQQGAANPYMVLTKVSRVVSYTYDDAVKLMPSRVQFDCYAITFGAAKNIARALEARISGMAETYGSTYFNGCFLDSERDSFEEAATPDKLFRTSLDFIIWHKGV